MNKDKAIEEIKDGKIKEIVFKHIPFKFHPVRDAMLEELRALFKAEIGKVAVKIVSNFIGWENALDEEGTLLTKLDLNMWLEGLKDMIESGEYLETLKEPRE